MKGMILAHAINLLDHIQNHTELIELKKARMNELRLPIHQRAQAGKDFLQLCTERIEFREELDEILDTYLGPSITDLIHECTGL